jgi:hypothetical protein
MLGNIAGIREKKRKKGKLRMGWMEDIKSG